MGDRVLESSSVLMRKLLPSARMLPQVASGGCTPKPRNDSADSVRIAVATLIVAETSTGAIAFGTEAPCYQQAGISVVVFGPGSIDQAHKPDEYIALEQIDACASFMRRLMERLETNST